MTDTQIYSRVAVTDAAAALLRQLTAQHGPLMFHQSGGCCDGSAPMCFAADEFVTGPSDVRLGEIHGVPFWMSRAQFDYWSHTHLTVDVVPGRGAVGRGPLREVARNPAARVELGRLEALLEFRGVGLAVEHR